MEIQADQYIPFPMEEVSFDFELMGPSEKDPEMLDVLLVATRTENVDQRKAAVEAAGLSPRSWTSSPSRSRTPASCSRTRCPTAAWTATIAIVDFGASNTTFSVLKDMRVIYTRDFSFGGQQLTEEIMRTYGLSLEDAGRAKKEGGLPGNYQPEVLDPVHRRHDPAGQPFAAVLPGVRRGREQPDQILVCGGCANIAGVADMISSRVGIPTEIGDPLGQMKISTRRNPRASGGMRPPC